MTTPAPPPPPVAPTPPRRPRISYTQLGGGIPTSPMTLVPDITPKIPTVTNQAARRAATTSAPPAPVAAAAAAGPTGPGPLTDQQHSMPIQPVEAGPDEAQQWWPIEPEDTGPPVVLATTKTKGSRRKRDKAATPAKPPAAGKAAPDSVFNSGGPARKLLGRITGLDRLGGGPSDEAPGKRRGRKPAAGEQDWLNLVTGGGAPPEPAAQDEPPAPAGKLLAETASDMQLSKAPRELGPAVLRILAIAAAAMIFLAGAKQLLWNPIFGPSKASTAATPAATLDPAAAGQAATRYALDYFTYAPVPSSTTLGPGVQGDVTADLAAGQRWTGSGALQAQAALVGAVHTVDAAHAVVAVTVRVHITMPPAAVKATPATPAKPTPAAVAAQPRRDLGLRWVQLSVPVQLSAGAVLVGGGGAVFTGEVPAMIVADPAWQSDSPTALATQGVAGTFFAAYAASNNLTYLTVPGAVLTGLSGAATLVSLTGWTISTPTASASASGAGPVAGVGTGTVTWQLAGTDLQIPQPYTLALTSSQNRWYVSTITPAAVNPQ